MGRSIFIEDSVEQDILNLYGVTTWTTGVLIGQFSSQRDYIVHIAITPPQENVELSEEMGSGETKKSCVTKDSSLQKFDEDWFVQHCRQVNRMLTGGLKILGIFVFGSLEERNKLQVKFRQVLFLVHKMILSDLPTEKLGTNEQLILQVCSATKRTTCFTLDVSDSKASVHPADVKYQHFVSKWSALHCSFCLQLKLKLEKKPRNKSLYSRLKASLLPMVNKIAGSVGTINHAFMSDEQVLVQEKQRKHAEKNITKTKKDFEVELYLTESGGDDGLIERKSCCEEIILVGKLECQGFVHQRATVKDALDAVKDDVIRNLITRIQLLCEDLDEETLQGNNYDEVIDKNVTTWTLPKRVFAPICGGSVQVSDCIFKDEQPKDVINRLSELLGVSLIEKDLVSKEQFSDHVCTDAFEDTNDYKVMKVADEKKVINYKSFGAILTGFVTVVLAASIKFLWGD